MAGPTQSPSFRSGTDKKGQERERTGTTAGTVGRDVPDESKERHTEIAVEAGKKGDQSRKEKG